jgi:hypothetical protein
MTAEDEVKRVRSIQQLVSSSSELERASLPVGLAFFF